MKIISGGQTGVDRAALDAAIEIGVPTGGWCPKGRLAEDGRIAQVYSLQETESAVYQERTRKNVLDSDATLIIAMSRLSGGTALTRKFALNAGKTWLIINPETGDAVNHVLEWLNANKIDVLNVAGPRESTNPGIYRTTRKFLEKVLTEIKNVE